MLDDAAVWRHGIRPGPTEVGDQMRADGLGAIPWGPVSAVFRRVVG